MSEAQATSNFIILVPSQDMCSDWTFSGEKGNFRPEAKPKEISDHPNAKFCWSNWCGAHTSSFSFHLIHSSGIKIRCKQFLYDLGPLSALDHAALYDYSPEKMSMFQIADNRVGWLGFDYRNKKACSFYSFGTNVELRVIEGNPSDLLMKELACSFVPYEFESLQGYPTFAQRSYWNRYSTYRYLNILTKYRPPSSLWKVRWPWFNGSHQWLSRDDHGIWENIFVSKMEALSDWSFNSICMLGNPRKPAEIQFLFYPSNGAMHFQLWIRVIDIDQFRPKVEGAQDVPLDSFSNYQPFDVTEWSNATTQFKAASRSAYGPHDVIFNRNNKIVLVHMNAGQCNTLEVMKKITDILTV
ncbi:MAG: hypothetical protein KDD48_06115 [Bdellovibrionales bacterium]|nr:hypothetical protein [Bdellovibrionales bacterium]